MAQYLTFELADLYLGLPATSVQEVLRSQPVTDVPLAPSAVRGLMNLRGQIVILVDLRRRFGLADAADGSRPVNVLIHSNDELVSLLVDRVGDVLDIEPSAFEPVPETLDAETRSLLRGALQVSHRLLLELDPIRASYV